MKQLTENEFDDLYTPVLDADGNAVRDIHSILDVDSSKLWTIVDDGDGGLWALSG